jgi:hypothetical protein
VNQLSFIEFNKIFYEILKTTFSKNLNVAEHLKFGKVGKAFDGVAKSTTFHLHPVEFGV